MKKGRSSLFDDMYIPDAHDAHTPRTPRGGAQPRASTGAPADVLSDPPSESSESASAIPEYEYDDGDDENTQFPAFALFASCQVGDFAKVKSLLTSDRQCTPNVRDLNDHTPLHEAVLHNRVFIVRLLLKKGAEVDASGVYGLTPLHLACQIGSFRLVQLLVEHGADVNRETRFRERPLHFAARSGNKALVGYLLDIKGAHLDVVDVLGRTPLHVATEEKKVDIVRYFLLKGASTDVKDIEERQPRMVAGKGSGAEGLFSRVKMFKFALGENEDRKKQELVQQLKKYRVMYDKTRAMLDKKEQDRFRSLLT